MANPAPKSPQEVEVLYILPAIRRDLSLNLKELGMEQKAIAKLLNVTEPAISQYITSKRAAQVQFSEEMQEEIKQVARKMKETKSLLPILDDMQQLVKRSLQERTTCGMCQDHVPGVPTGCTACFK